MHMNQSIEHISYCMDFSNDEVDTYLIAPLQSKMKHPISTETYSEAKRNSHSRARGAYFSVFFDGKTDDSEFFINLYGGQTSIFFFNDEILFIDDTLRHLYTSEDKYGKMVYSPALLGQEPGNILDMFAQIILFLSSALNISVKTSECERFDEPDYCILCERADKGNNKNTTLDFGNLHFFLAL